MKTFVKSVILFSFLFVVSQTYAQMQFPAIFSDNMVLQQQSDAPIWGKATPGSTVKIVPSWNGKEYNATVDANGKWVAKLQTPSAGGPFKVTVTNNKTTKTFQNVMIGEVWICSGQSNMEMPLAGWGKVKDYEKEIAEAMYPNIRLLQVQKATSPYPLDDVKVDGGSWQECSPATIALFSATAYFFGRDLHKNLNVPIGLINTSWGGTIAEAWTSKESLMNMPYFNNAVEAYSSLPKDVETRKASILKKQEEWNKDAMAKDFGFENSVPVASKLNYNDNEWMSAKLPGAWETNGLPDFDGVVWFRKVIDIPAQWTNKELSLSLGTIDDSDITYFNGVEIGRTDGHNVPRKYIVPKSLVKKGKAVIVIRAFDTASTGGVLGEPADFYISPKNNTAATINLDGDWKYKSSVNIKDLGTFPRLENENPNVPTALFNAMMAPLIPYKIKGAIWYQGESNADRAYQYRTLFPLMINDWRTKWGYDFSFYFVQLANFMAVNEKPIESTWAELREAQLQTLNLENTGMATIIDIGDANDIHPKNKQDVGIRLALEARKNDYKQDITSSGPLYHYYKLEGDKIRIYFKPDGSKLKVNSGAALKGFSIAGPDKKFYWADAVIDGNQIVVSSPEVAFPVAVRYAWANNPICNLSNTEGLPASPFRTDNWTGLTEKNQ
ncbi:MAG: sialate O-acetylesterase [Dysgonamonadaceae bacterium]